MRIYLAFFQTQARGPGTANYGFWADMMRAGLQEGGHTVLESPTIDWTAAMNLIAPGALAAWRDRTWSAVLGELAAEQARGGVDLFLGYFFPQQVEPAAVHEIRRRGIPAVNFFCDNVREFRRVPDAYRPFDLHWVPEWEALPLYRAAGLAHIHAPMPVWIPPDYRHVSDRESPDVTFLGSRDPLRSELFGRLEHLDVRVSIRGKGWQPDEAPASAPVATDLRERLGNQADFVRQHGLAAWLRKFRPGKTSPAPEPPTDWLGAPVSREEYLRLSRESAVTLGVNRYDSPRLRPGEIAAYSRLRDIEAPMLGACYLTEWAPGLDQLYDLEEEITTYRDVAGLAAQIQRLLADPTRRLRLRHAAQRRALQAHTIGMTLQKITSALGLRAVSRA